MKYLTLILALLFLGCSLDGTEPEEVVCTEEFVYGLQVFVRDNTTNDPITSGITVVAIDSGYEEELMLAQGEDFYIGAGERPGNYIIQVTSDDYVTFNSGVIQVTANQCHVITRLVEILLQPI